MLGLGLEFNKFIVSSGGVWTPLEITTILWLDASDVSTITESGGAVSKWNDKSGNGNDVSQVTGANQPSYADSKITFSNANETYLFRNSTNFTSNYIFLVSSINDVGQINSLVSNGFNNSNIRRNSVNESLYLPSTNVGDFGHNDAEYFINATVTTAITYGQKEIISVEKGSLTSSDFNNFYIGRPIVGSFLDRVFDGDMCEIILLPTKPALSDRQKLEGYLAWKWGLQGNLPAEHPYKTDGSLFGYSPSVWTPGDITTLAWLDASDESTITETGGLVSNWADKSNSFNATQITDSLKPLSGANTLNNLNLLTLANDYLDLSITNIKSVIFVVDIDVGTLVQPIISDATSINYTFIKCDSDDYDISIDGGIGTTGNASVNGESLVSGTNIELGLTKAEKLGSNIWYADYDTMIDVASLFRQSGNIFSGKIAEIVFLPTVPTQSDRQKLEGYLAWKWGLEGNLPAGHPYKTDGSLFGY